MSCSRASLACVGAMLAVLPAGGVGATAGDASAVGDVSGARAAVGAGAEGRVPPERITSERAKAPEEPCGTPGRDGGALGREGGEIGRDGGEDGRPPGGVEGRDPAPAAPPGPGTNTIALQYGQRHTPPANALSMLIFFSQSVQRIFIDIIQTSSKTERPRAVGASHPEANTTIIVLPPSKSNGRVERCHDTRRRHGVLPARKPRMPRDGLLADSEAWNHKKKARPFGRAL